MATARATAETLSAAALSAGLECERLTESLTCRLLNVCSDGKCTPPIAPELVESTDLPRVPPILVPTEDGCGWEAVVPMLAPPAGVAPRSQLCSSAGVAHFDDARGAVFRYGPPGAWCIHDLMLDLQGVAMTHALLRRMEALRAGGHLEGVRLAEASCAGVGMITPTRKHVRFEWHGGTSAEKAVARPTEPQPPRQPLLHLRVRVDGVALPSVHRESLQLISAGAFAEILRQCDRGALPGGAQ
jgi:hypothetical protein